MIQKDNGFPYYLQIYQEIRERILTKVYLPNHLIPSENDLVKEFGVTRATVRNAIKKLQSEGLILTEKGKGSYVNQPKIEQSLFRFYSFGRDHSELNKNSVLLGIKDEQNAEVQKALNLSDNQKVKRITRIRSLNHLPVIIENSYIPSDIAPDIEAYDLESLSIYDLLENTYGCCISRAKEFLDTCVTDRYYSELLEVDEGMPVFLIKRITYDLKDIPIEFRESVIRSDKFTFSVDLKLR
ncbi:GntR family transcriptional regulator [Lacrimispora sp.]|uniref:GntR family transcriptional regulator n=1 Tax=Lacrimispora sp. TaxID=2719234 RepID=UPI003992CC1F